MVSVCDKMNLLGQCGDCSFLCFYAEAGAFQERQEKAFRFRQGVL